LDISQLRQQYRKLKERNKQVQVLIQSTELSFVFQKKKNCLLDLAASHEQKQRARAPSLYPTLGGSTENVRRPTITSAESSPSKLSANVCSIASGPLVTTLGIPVLHSHYLLHPSIFRSITY
jgi:hypothetical protein